MKKSIIFGIIFLISIVSTIAVKPSVSSTGIEGELVLLMPLYDAIQFNSSMKFHVHILNSSGKLLTANQTTCTGHWYYPNGSHIIEMDSNDDSNGIEEVFIINSSQTGYIGVQQVNVWCNSTQQEYGYFEGGYYLTESGKLTNTNGTGILIGIMFIPFLFAIIFLIGGVSLGQTHGVLKIFLYLLSVPMVWVSLNIGLIGLIEFYGLSNIQNLVAEFTFWISVVYSVMITYFVIYAVWKMFDTMAQKKKEKLEY
jgi:hypothetical protein